MNNKLEMDSQLFYFLNLIFALFFLIWFFRAKNGAGRKPTVLDLRAPDTNSNGGVLQKDSQKPVTHTFTPNPPPAKEAPKTEPPKGPTDGSFRDVTHTSATAEEKIKTQKKRNSMFMFNGHDWDAFEVLGISSSATLPEITKQYQKLIRDADKAQIDFYEIAYKTLLKEF